MWLSPLFQLSSNLKSICGLEVLSSLGASTIGFVSYFQNTLPFPQVAGSMLLDGWKFGHLNNNMSHLYQTLLISSVMILTDVIIEQENLTAHVEIFMSIPFTFEN